MPKLSAKTVTEAAERAARAIPPLWPLASSVAVNPFLGQTNEPLPMTAARLGRAGGIALTMPRAWFTDKVVSGEISDQDLQDALSASSLPLTLETLKRAMQQEPARPSAAPTIASLAAAASGTDWPALVAERISHWAASYFDEGQALWPMAASRGAWSSWGQVASHDLTPEIAGLRGFAQQVEAAPDQAPLALLSAIEELGLSGAALESYGHRLLAELKGWSQLARYRLWQAELNGGSDQCLTDLLAIRMMFEVALFRQYGAEIGGAWDEARKGYAVSLEPTDDQRIDAVLQEAVERASQRRLSAIMATSAARPQRDKRPALQAAFCIDVRSEVFRRALESVDPSTQTLGFAGFFGLGVSHRRFASDLPEHRLPVLLNPAHTSSEGTTSPEDVRRDRAARIGLRAKRAWGRFKLAAVSSFAFVEATGPVFAGKLLRDSLGSKRPGVLAPVPQFDPPLPLDTKVGMAQSILGAMSLTRDFARLVLLTGHGVNVVNNPHASGLHCGACGGYSGEVNARLLAGLLNDRDVRQALAHRGVPVPEDTLFLGALHDTTSDAVTIFEDGHVSPDHHAEVQQARRWLAQAGLVAATERAARLPRAATARDLATRTTDWAELRPEWALAGCQAFIAAPRARTTGKDLAGRAFLHDYNWCDDQGFGVLELIMTAPVVVASWISLQYYGSVVAPELFGGGNKLLHNVTGGIGVVEGNGGLLRGGLPIQSVHDGERFVHEPLRLSVLIEAPREAMSEILSRHPGVRELFDNGWLHLFSLDDEGRMAWRYRGDLEWEGMASTPAEPAEDRIAA